MIFGRLGFTGTRNGLTTEQECVLRDATVSEICKPSWFRHGSCKGADVQAARIMRERFKDTIVIIAHPGPIDDQCQEDSGVDDFKDVPKTHFARNRDIVNKSDLLLACPGYATWQKRGGTFYTMDYALQKKKMVIVIWPNGTVETYA